MKATVERAERLERLKGHKIAVLDCGKRNGRPILASVARRLGKASGATMRLQTKPSAHRMCSRTLVDRLSAEFDAIVYGVVDCCSAASCSVRDALELELRGVPVALIVATGRVVQVARRRGVFHLTHGFAEKIYSAFESPWARRQMCKFGYHRALRMAGCRAGSRVRLPGGTVSWSYPSEDEELSCMPAGFGNWSSKLDGVRNFEHVEVDSPRSRMTNLEIEASMEHILPRVISILTK